MKKHLTITLRKILSVTAVLTLLLGSFMVANLGSFESRAAVADENAAKTIWVSTKEQFMSAVNNANDGDIVKLSNNITLRAGNINNREGDRVVVKSNCFVTIDLNGKTLTCGSASCADTFGVATGSALLMQNGNIDNFDTNNSNSGTIILNKVRITNTAYLGNTKMYVVNNTTIKSISTENGALNPNTSLNPYGSGKSISNYNYANPAPAIVGSGVTWNCYQDMDTICRDANKGSPYDKIVMLTDFNLQKDAKLTRGGVSLDFNNYSLNEGDYNLHIENTEGVITLRNGKLYGNLDMMENGSASASSGVKLSNMTIVGNVDTDGHTVTIESGTYKGNITQSGDGVITIYEGTFNGHLKDALRDEAGEAVGFFIMGGIFTYKPLDSWIAHGYKIVPLARGGYEVVHDDHYGWIDWTNTSAMPTTAGNYCLNNNVTLSGTWTVPGGTTNICLYRHTIGTNAKTQSIINVPAGATLNIYDCKESGSIGGISSTSAIGAIENYGTVNLYSGSISENTSAIGAAILNHGTATVNGGTIKHNTSKGAVANCSDGDHNASLTINKGTFEENTGNPDGAGAIYANKIVTIKDGIFKNNITQGSGGAIRADATGTLTITGGSFINNTADANGGALSVTSGANVSISGGNFKGNTATKGIGEDIYGPASISKSLVVGEWGLGESDVITLAAALEEGTSISVDKKSSSEVAGVGVFTQAYNSQTNETSAKFFSLSPTAYVGNKSTNGSSVAVVYNNNELEIITHTHSWKYVKKSGKDNKVYVYCDTSESHCGNFSNGEVTGCAYLELRTPTVQYSGATYNYATVINQITPITSAGVTVEYYVVKENQTEVLTGTEASNGGAAASGKEPREPGNYKLKAIIGEQEAYSAFSITDTNIKQKDAENYTLAEIPNQKNVDGKLARKVDGYTKDNFAKLNISLTTKSDKITIYKLADIEWDENERDFKEIAWVNEVDDWVKNHPLYGNKDLDGNTNIYATPSDLGTSYDVVWREFYRAMLTNKDNVTYSATDNPDGLAPLYADLNYTSEIDNPNGIKSYITTVSNLAMGQYGIVATYGGKTLEPVVINIVPERASPNGSYYLAYEYDTALKESLAQIEKTINDKRSEIVEPGQVVDFRVVAQVPPLESTWADSDYKVTTLYIEDHMDDAFTLKPDSIKIYYNNDNDLDSDKQHRKEHDEAFPSDGTEYYKVSHGNNTIATPNIKDAAANTDGVIKVELNIDNLKTLIQNQSMSDGIQYVVMEYQATVTDRVDVNSEANYNTVLLFYNLGQGVKYSKDTVLAYTYGLQVVKIDGDTYDKAEVDPRYLAGAKFKLYKEITDMSDITDINSADFAEYPDPADPNNTMICKVVKLGQGFDDDAGNFTTASDGTVTISGLKPGRYVLSETMAPINPDTGVRYNALSEDMMFEIFAISDEEALRRAGSYVSCRDEKDGQIIENGIVSISVLNYLGFTLPSTGGMGTLIFTIIGIAVMTIVIVVIMKRRNR